MRVLVTGANGFIGRELINLLYSHAYKVRGSIRAVSQLSHPHKGCEYVSVGSLSNTTDWRKALDGVDVVIHLAARAHMIHESGENLLHLFRKVNVDATLHLAQESMKYGVKRFIYLSSIGVNGSFNIKPFTELDIPSPTQDYAVSKFEAEQVLRKLAPSEMEVVIIRPPLVYGPSAPGNFSRLMYWMYKNAPLPFGSIHNKRSFVALDNLVDLILICINHPAAANEVFLVADGEDLSTSEFLQRIAIALNKRSRLLPINQKLLEFCLKLTGKKDLYHRLCDSLQVDISKARNLLNWTPPVGVDEELRKTVEQFLSLNRKK